MKGAILAGGRGTRLMPLTAATNKHLLPVGGEPMIYHAIRQMVSAGIHDVMVVTSTDHMGEVVRCLGSGEQFNVELTYRVQERPGGIAHALAMTEGFTAGGRLCVVLADNVFQYSIRPYADAFRAQRGGARVLLKSVAEPRHYGVAALDEKHILEIQEKPEQPPSNYAVVGLYFYDAEVFDHIRQVRPSARGELEVTSVNNRYIEAKTLEYDICHGDWTDAGSPDSYQYANQMLFAQQNAVLDAPPR